MSYILDRMDELKLRPLSDDFVKHLMGVEDLLQKLDRGCAAQPEVPRRRDRGRLPVLRCDPGQDEGNVQTLLEDVKDELKNYQPTIDALHEQASTSSRRTGSPDQA